MPFAILCWRRIGTASKASNASRSAVTIIAAAGGNGRSTAHLPTSLRLDAGRHDDGPSPVNLSFVVATRRLRRLLFRRYDLQPQIGKAPAYAQISKCISDGRIELANNSLRSVLGCPNGKPDRNVHARHSRLVHRRDRRRRGHPAFVGDGVSPDAAGRHLRQRVGCYVDHHVDLACHQVLHRQRAAAIGHER